MNTFQIDIGLKTADAALSNKAALAETFRCQEQIEAMLSDIGDVTNISSGCGGGIRDFQLELKTERDKDAVSNIIEYYVTEDDDYYSVS